MKMETRRAKEMKKVAVYGRVSTTDKGQDVNLQLRDLRAYVGGEGGRPLGSMWITV